MSIRNLTEDPIKPTRLRFVPIPEHVDTRGRLRVCEIGGSLPFTPVRTFLISDVAQGATRAGHSVSCDLFLSTVCGSCYITAVTGKKQERYRLHAASGGVHVPAHTWILLSDFAAGTVVLAHAEKVFKETSYREAV